MMNNWLIVTIASFAALLVIVAAAVLILQDEQDNEGEGDAGDPGSDDAGDTSENGTGDEDSGDTSQESPDEGGEASIEVASARIDEGDCLFESSPNNETCHHLRVLVNAATDDTFDVSIPWWDATDTQGGNHSADWVVSPDPVSAGTSRSVTVSFDMTNDSRLSELRYSVPGGSELSAQVPDY